MKCGVGIYVAGDALPRHIFVSHRSGARGAPSYCIQIYPPREKFFGAIVKTLVVLGLFYYLRFASQLKVIRELTRLFIGAPRLSSMALSRRSFSMEITSLSQF